MFFPFFFNILKANSISFNDEAPVDSKIFLFFFLINSNKGKFVISPEGILIKSTPFFNKNFKLSTSNAVDKKFIFFLLQYLISFS